ncbi:MAG: tRNA pseudouridine(55) synthase TruB [Deltaproteobacteria bacterium]|nr:tRNA pseudouridine(55) synthase TruB [Deltaproteobacteria bacterium]
MSEANLPAGRIHSDRAPRNRVRRPLVSSVLLVDKPKGLTSHDVVSRVRRAVGQREVGHTGTLDPMATGLLVVTLGAATRIGRFLESADKGYTATLALGRATDTEDADGRTIATAPVRELSRAELEAAARSLVGELDQRVPAYSAVRVGGERLHKKARRGEEVERPVRRIVVHELEVGAISNRGPEVEVELRARVSKGTYVRTLGVELAARLSLPGHLTALRRSSVGTLSVEHAVSLDAISREGDPSRVTGAIPIDRALAHLPVIDVAEAELEWVRHGRPLRPDQLHLRRGGFERGDPILLLHGDAVVAVAFAEVSSRELLSTDPLASSREAPERALAYACVLVGSVDPTGVGR